MLHLQGVFPIVLFSADGDRFWPQTQLVQAAFIVYYIKLLITYNS